METKGHKMKISNEEIEGAVDRVAGALTGLTGFAVGGRAWTLAPNGGRGDVVRMTRRYGVQHLFELRDVLSELARRRPELLGRLLHNPGVIIDLNAGAGLNSLALALIAKSKGVKLVVRFIEHAPAALEFALELAEAVGVDASGHLVTKNFADAGGQDPEGMSTLTNAHLAPPVPAITGPVLIFAGHAINCFKFGDEPHRERRQLNLEAQNSIILRRLAAELDPAAAALLMQVDVGASSAWRVDWLADQIDTVAPRARQVSEHFRVTNRSGREGALSKYAALVELAPITTSVGAQAENLILFPAMYEDIFVTADELDALLGNPQPAMSLCDTEELDLLLMAGRS